jgi:hypothetical protein
LAISFSTESAWLVLSLTGRNASRLQEVSIQRNTEIPKLQKVPEKKKARSLDQKKNQVFCLN